jgi:hypothetical protein
MRFVADGPSIPDILLERCDAGRVVFLCGAGVSLPSGMPSFVDLTKYIIDFFGPSADSEIMAAFQPWLVDQSAANVPLDQIFNLLHQEYGKDEVNSLVTKRLSTHLGSSVIGYEHSLIRRISSSSNGVPQIVTTNFDRLFEAGPEAEHLVPHVPPAFPDLNFGSKIEGITYLHGRLEEAVSESHPYVLSSADFGRAYLSEGWATNFIRHLLERYTVVLVGYKAEDPPIKYLLQGLNHDGQYDRSRLYAFDCGSPEGIEAKWRDRGVTPIAYSGHPVLWNTMAEWAKRADNPRKWRSSIIDKCQHDPKHLAPYERGQVAHVLRTVQGAKLFSEAYPLAHPEWVCVMDANVRSAQKSHGFGKDREVFDPCTAYGLDDDLKELSDEDRREELGNDNILVWRDEDDNPSDCHRLSGRKVEGFESTPRRLGYLINWISKSVKSPVIAWWAMRLKGLHPQLLHQFEWQVERSQALNVRARHVWNLILENQRDPRNHRWDGEWFELKKRIHEEGWSASVLRKFRKVTTPRLEIKPPYGLGHARPPSVSWEELHLGDLGQFEVVFLQRHNEELDIPDELLPKIVSTLEEQLTVASGLLADIGTVYFPTPTCYPEGDADGREYITETADVVSWFVQLFDRLAAKCPDLANAHATTWPDDDRFFFRKLKLYAFSKKEAFEANYVAENVFSLDQETFWDEDVARELLFLLVDRWQEFSDEFQKRLFDRIITGPDQPSHWSDEEYFSLRNEAAARYARYLELRGCAFTADRSSQIANMICGIPRWSDSWATSTVSNRGTYSGRVRMDENSDLLLNLPPSEIVPRAKEDLKRDFGSFTERRSFTGLVKTNPRKALSALTLAGKSGDYPPAFWSAMIDELPANIPPRLRRVILNRVSRLPHTSIAELSHTMGQWLEKNFAQILAFDDILGWTLYDHIVAGILSGGVDAVKSGLGDILSVGKATQQSRRTYNHAINSPLGKCIEALFHAVPGEEQEAFSLIPEHIKSRIERLFTVSGEGSDNAISVVFRQLNWLMHVDPAWVKERLIPMLVFEHTTAEPAWNGLLHNRQGLSEPLAELIKPLLLGLIPWIETLAWNRDLLAVSAHWLGYMRVFHPDEPCGLSRGEMRAVLRDLSDDIRNRFISWLSSVGQTNKNGWTKYVIPLINEDWPRERCYRTSASMKAWINLLDDTGDSFQAVYESVKKFLVPVEINDQSFYRFSYPIGDEKPIAALFPEETLDMMNKITPQTLSRPPFELSKLLELIAENEPALTSDPRFLRLLDLVERY